MKKLLIEINTPGNGKHYEFQLDSDLTVHEAKQMIIDEITQLEGNGISLDPVGTILCSMNTRHVLVESDTLAAAGMVSGHGYVLL